MSEQHDECQERWLDCTRTRQARVDKAIKENPDATVDELAKLTNVTRRTIFRAPAYRQKMVTSVTKEKLTAGCDGETVTCVTPQPGNYDQRIVDDAVWRTSQWGPRVRAEDLEYAADIAKQRAEADWTNPLRSILSEAEEKRDEVWWRSKRCRRTRPKQRQDIQRWDGIIKKSSKRSSNQLNFSKGKRCSMLTSAFRLKKNGRLGSRKNLRNASILARR
jgi:hypothetical protein